MLASASWACSNGPGADAASGGTASGGYPTSGAGGGESGGSGGSEPTASGGTQTAAGGAGAGGLGAGGGSGGAPPGPCTGAAPELAVTRLETTSVGEMGRPFDPDSQDNSGPTSWAARYGKTPEIIALPDGDGLRILFQDQDSDSAAFVVHVVPSDGEYVIDAAFEVEILGRIMGFALDEAGHYYVASGVDEDEMVDAVYPPNDIHRPNVVRVSKFDVGGCVLMESDVDMERGEVDGPGGQDAEIIVNPMVAASSRLVYGDGQLALVHGHNTEPDAELDGTRHQKAITTHLDAMTGSVTRASSMWVSHSFDQRALFDGVGFVEVHLGDAYPRTIAFGRYFGAESDGDHALFSIKGETGDNETFTRLGGVVQTTDPTYGYLATFASERTPAFDGDGAVQGTRDLGLVRIRSNFSGNGSIVEEGGSTSTLTVTSGGEEVTNSLHWLTDLGPDRHVERPRIVALSGTEFVLLWEEWTTGDRDQYQGTFAMTIDASAQIIAGPSEIPGQHHISRGDDAVRLGDRAVYVTGSTAGLHLNIVAPDLSGARITLP